MAQIPVFFVICLAVGGPYLFLGWLHYDSYGVNVAAQIVLLFLCINLLICLWELCLCYRYSLIRSTHLKRVKDGQTKSVKIVVFRWMEMSEILSPSFWANIWIDYSRYDPAYTDSQSAGYNIDVGNGHSTLLPTLFLMVSMVKPIVGPKATGMVGLVMNYQMLYGSLVYFFAFFNSKTPQKLNLTTNEAVLAVVMPSMVWVIIPFVAIVMSVQMIMEDSFSAWQ